MDANRLREISYRLPDSSATARAFFDGLVELLGGVPVPPPAYPAGALPVTSLSLAGVAGPEVVFEPGPAIDLTVGPLQLRGSTVDSARPVIGNGDRTAPGGAVLPGLEHVFRVVRVPPPWPGLGIRFDLYYRTHEYLSDWTTGKWLVTEG